jgi:hypothetical protein
MAYTLSCAHFGTWSNMIQCFESMNHFVRLDLGPDGLEMQSSDHDETTLLKYSLPVMSTTRDDCPPPPRSMVYMACAVVLQFLQSVQGDVHIEFGVSPDEDEAAAAAWWSLRDTTGHVWRWTTGLCRQEVWSPRQICHDRVVCMETAEFLLYAQHIALCESFVDVYSHGPYDLSLQAKGELVAIRIQNNPLLAPPSPLSSYTLRCTFKYVRALLSILQKTESVNLFITHQTSLCLQVEVAPGTLSVLLRNG